MLPALLLLLATAATPGECPGDVVVSDGIRVMLVTEFERLGHDDQEGLRRNIAIIDAELRRSDLNCADIEALTDMRRYAVSELVRLGVDVSAYESAPDRR